MKAIAVRTAINHYHKTKVHNLMFAKLGEDSNDISSSDLIIENLTDEHLVNLVNELPEGCRMVFNLYAVEGYSHAEVAEMLQIGESTSRSQLHHAKFLLKEKLKCQNLARYYEKFA